MKSKCTPLRIRSAKLHFTNSNRRLVQRREERKISASRKWDSLQRLWVNCTKLRLIVVWFQPISRRLNSPWWRIQLSVHKIKLWINNDLRKYSSWILVVLMRKHLWWILRWISWRRYQKEKIKMSWCTKWRENSLRQLWNLINLSIYNNCTRKKMNYKLKSNIVMNKITRFSTCGKKSNDYWQRATHSQLQSRKGRKRPKPRTHSRISLSSPSHNLARFSPIQS